MLLKKLNRELRNHRQGFPSYDKLRGIFTFGRHTIRWSFSKDSITIEIFDPIMDIFLDRVSFFLEDHAIGWDMIDTGDTNAWDANGFADAADYARYRY